MSDKVTYPYTTWEQYDVNNNKLSVEEKTIDFITYAFNKNHFNKLFFDKHNFGDLYPSHLDAENSELKCYCSVKVDELSFRMHRLSPAGNPHSLRRELTKMIESCLPEKGGEKMTAISQNRMFYGMFMKEYTLTENCARNGPAQCQESMLKRYDFELTFSYDYYKEFKKILVLCEDHQQYYEFLDENNIIYKDFEIQPIYLCGNRDSLNYDSIYITLLDIPVFPSCGININDYGMFKLLFEEKINPYYLLKDPQKLIDLRKKVKKFRLYFTN